ncbi:MULTISPECIES: hypothetical protein [unclassified Nocardiopsis]|uniref:hypothetical protein n=1 Tax=Nocardiopsis TaxID=2013 RepID=UPI00387B4AD0
MSHPHGPDRRAVLRGAALTTGTAVLGGAALLGAASPAAAAPAVHDRAAWGARPPSSPIQVLAAPPLYIVVHHTATANSTDHSLAHAYSLSRAIQNHHLTSSPV